jgi:hypothetical protein
MVKRLILHKVVRLIYGSFKGRCVTVSEVAEFVKKSKLEASYSLVKFALDSLIKEGKAKKVKLYRSYAIYCIGKEPKFNEVIEHGKIEECVVKLIPSFTLIQLAVCVLGHRPVGSPSMIYASILYVLMRMVKDKKIYSFTILPDSKDRLKVIIKK